MVYGYIRCSTIGQTTENQKIQIKQYCKLHKLHNIKWISETISGTKPPSKRKLGELLNTVQKDDVIIVTELSRLGRSLIMIMNILQEFIDKGVKVKAIKEGFDCGNSITSKVLIFAFGLCAELERTLLSERTKNGLERARQQGKQIGRQKGQKPNFYKLTPQRYKIKRWLKEGRSKLSIAKELGVSWKTVNVFVNEHLNDKLPAPLTERPQKHGHPTKLEQEWFKKHE